MEEKALLWEPAKKNNDQKGKRRRKTSGEVM